MVKATVEFLQFSFREENGTVVLCDVEVCFLPGDWDVPIMTFSDQEVVHVER